MIVIGFVVKLLLIFIEVALSVVIRLFVTVFIIFHVVLDVLVEFIILSLKCLFFAASIVEERILQYFL